MAAVPIIAAHICAAKGFASLLNDQINEQSIFHSLDSAVLMKDYWDGSPDYITVYIKLTPILISIMQYIYLNLNPLRPSSSLALISSIIICLPNLPFEKYPEAKLSFREKYLPATPSTYTVKRNDRHCSERRCYVLIVRFGSKIFDPIAYKLVSW